MQIVFSSTSSVPSPVKVESNDSKVSDFLAWQQNESLGAYAGIKSVIAKWTQSGISNYLIFAKADSNQSHFGIEVFPYKNEGWWFTKQLKVLVTIIFKDSVNSLPKDASNIQQIQNAVGNIIPKVSTEKHVANQSKDVFCDDKIIEFQRVFEGRHINILYNVAPLPLNKEKLHFLLVPKRHVTKFEDLLPEEYAESIALTQKLVRHYREKGYSSAYIFNKNGKEAGQTVPHWHEHVIFAASKTEELFGKFQVLLNMIRSPTRLSRPVFIVKKEALIAELA